MGYKLDYVTPNPRALEQIDSFYQNKFEGNKSASERWDRKMRECWNPRDADSWADVLKQNPASFYRAWAAAIEFAANQGDSFETIDQY